MEYLVEEKPGFKVVGLSVDTSMEKVRNEVPPLWEEFMKRFKEISNAKGGMKNYGVCFETEKNDGFRYVACSEVSDFENIPEEMVMADVEASKYAVFTHKGRIESLGKTYSDILAFVKEKDMKQKPWWVEFYDDRWKGDKPESEFEIWIAIE
jgi:AraC family transcriptional regulator